MTFSRADQIDNIIQQRRPLAERVAQVQNHLKQLETGLRELRDCQAAIMETADPQLQGHLRDIDLEPVIVKIAHEIESMSKLQGRLKRDTINIGVIGKAKQGKSRLLQSLSGLTAVEIPDGDRQHCTGVTSTIYHNPDVDPYAEVYFYTENQFVREVIAAYYNDLKLGPPPRSLAEFQSQSLPLLNENLVSGVAVTGEKYKHLKKYKENLGFYRQLLTEPSPLRIPIEDIRYYVAQETLTGEPIYQYLAIEEVKIICNFPHHDVGRIAMIDMPGLGDTGIGDQERMLRVLSEDIDFVFFVRMPAYQGEFLSDVDVALYDLARRALDDLPIERWSMMVLNRTQLPTAKADNAKSCELLLNIIQHTPHMPLVKCVIADCANPADAGQQVLDTALDYLVGEIQKLDESYAMARQESLNRLQQEIETKVTKSENVSDRYSISDADDERFDELYEGDDSHEGLWDTIATGLEQLVRELRVQRDQSNLIFEQRIQEVLEECEAIPLPTLDQIERILRREGGYDSTYEHFLHVARTEITRAFSHLDEALAHTTRQIKRQVMEVLVHDGQLGGLIDTDDGEVFLQQLNELMGDDLPTLKLALQNLYEFRLSYRGFIMHEVRKELECLDTYKKRFPLPVQANVEHVAQNLELCQKETVYRLRKAVEEWLPKPNAAAFAVVEEFADQFLRSKNATIELRKFYRRNKATVWDEFENFGIRAQARIRWQASISRVAKDNQPHLMRFI